MVFPCLRLPSSSSSCCCASAAAPILLSNRAAGPISSGGFLFGGRDGFQSVAPGGASLSSSGSHNRRSTSKRMNPNTPANYRAPQTFETEKMLVWRKGQEPIKPLSNVQAILLRSQAQLPTIEIPPLDVLRSVKGTRS